MSDTVPTTNSACIYLGRVKWFNNKTGYGFISVTSGDRSGTDLFVHHTSIDVADQQYKYLVQGEYVEFEIINAETAEHEYQTRNVRGISGGKLMCETRRDMRTNQVGYRKSNENNDVTDNRVNKTRPRGEGPRGGGPRENDTNKEWNFVGKKSGRFTNQRTI
jgi:CspA family cold shock protein